MGEASGPQIGYRIPIIAAKRCPVCGVIGTYDVSSYKMPQHWIRLRAFGVDEIVCSMDCVTQIRIHQEMLQKQLDETRKIPLLPPDVVLSGTDS
jgi:hypothetical protein